MTMLQNYCMRTYLQFKFTCGTCQPLIITAYLKISGNDNTTYLMHDDLTHYKSQ